MNSIVQSWWATCLIVSFCLLLQVRVYGASSTQTIYIDYGSSSSQTSATGWNNSTGTNWNNGAFFERIAEVVDSTGAVTGVSVYDTGWVGYQTTTSNGTGYPDSAGNDSIYDDTAGGGTIKLAGLINTNTYDFIFYGSEDSAGRETSYTIGGSSVTLINTNNVNNTVTLTGISPSGGVIEIEVKRSGSSSRGFINVLEITGHGTFGGDVTPPNPPNVLPSSFTSTYDRTPTWTWTSGGGDGNGTFRYKLDSSDLTVGATETTSLSYTPASSLSLQAHKLYVQERDDAGNWSTSTVSEYFVQASSAPQLVWTPTTAAVDVAIDSTITIDFDQAIRNANGTDITNSNLVNILLLKIGSTDVSFTAIINTGKNKITITPNADLAYNTLYTVYCMPIENTNGDETNTESTTLTTVSAPVTTFDVTLPSGISLFGYAGVSAANAQTVFQSAIDAQKLKYVRTIDSATGLTKALFYNVSLAAWVNEIGNLESGQGYIVETTSATTLTISGTKLTTSVSQNLPSTYSLIGYTATAAQDAATAFDALIQSGKLDLIRWIDPSTGTTKELYYRTSSAGWVNEIGNVTVDQAYIVKLNAAHSGFQFP